MCDAMLCGLARWLRLAGLDTTFDSALDDAALAAVARREGRWLLTRDRVLAARAGPRVILLHRAGIAEQLAELMGRLGLSFSPERFFTRCSLCNGELEEVPREVVVELVPPFVAAHASRFSRCASCGKVYWPGTHHARIQRRLDELLSAVGRKG